MYDIHYDDNSLVIYKFVSLKVSHLFTLKPYTIQPVTCTIERERKCKITIHWSFEAFYKYFSLL